MPILPARFIREIGARGHLRIYWDRRRLVAVEPCPDGVCGGHPKYEWRNECRGVHNAMALIGDKLGMGAKEHDFGKIEDYAPERWPTSCEDCGTPVPLGPVEAREIGDEGIYLVKQVFVSRLYDSPSGKPEPGDVYRLEWHDPGQCHYWDNCDGVHVIGHLPNGHRWDIDSRASNCDRKDDRTHRCWVRRGSPEDGTLDVGKGTGVPGETCTAGAGSIAVEGWHGYLRNFTWEG